MVDQLSTAATNPSAIATGAVMTDETYTIGIEVVRAAGLNIVDLLASADGSLNLVGLAIVAADPTAIANLAGTLWPDNSDLDTASHRHRRADPEGPTEGWTSLSERERAVAVLASHAMTNIQIGRELYVSRHTVNYHMRNIFRKLGIRSRVQLVQHVPRDRV